MKKLQEKKYGDIAVVQNGSHKWGVLGGNDEVIVPFGKYNWIDGFDCGLARVVIDGETKEDNRWGIINEEGEEVLPVVYEEVWNFYGKDRKSTTVIKNGEKHIVYFQNLNPNLIDEYDDSYNDYDDYDESHYDRYAGSYAQDYEGWSDEDIDNVFDGNPDLYWNID